MTVRQKEVKTSFEMIREVPRNNSVSHSRPAEINQILADLRQDDETGNVMQAVVDALLELKDHSVELPRTLEPCRAMTPCRFAALITACTVICVLNLTAFSLSTFYDMGTK